jgi:HD superfamily phosphohydrolase
VPHGCDLVYYVFAFHSPVNEYLTERDRPTELVRCPVHGFIHYSKNEREVIDHKAFQRLRNVRQLALSHYLYPGATHSRFEHSLGVMEMVTRALDSIGLKHRKLINAELSEIRELRQNTWARARQTLRMFALLHDVGHPAFSHAAEDVIPGGNHEEVSLYVVRDVMGKKLDKLFFKGIASLLVRLFQKSPEATFLRGFVAGEMDMDRTDYLLRDSLHCGVDYGRFDFRRLIESLTVYKNRDTGRIELAIERGGEHTFEALILARYQMNTQVYYHRLRRIYDYYLTEYMKIWGKEHYKTMDDVLRFDDIKLLSEISKDAETNNSRSRWAKRIVNRTHHKVVYETGDNADLILLKKAKRILGLLRTKFRSVDFYLDDNAKSIHKLTVHGQQDEQRVEDFFLIEKDGTPRLITEQSAVLEKIPATFRSVRIYADASSKQLKKIRLAARDAEKEI